MPIPAKKLKQKKKVETLLGRLEPALASRANKASLKLGWMRAGQDAEDLVRLRLIEAGVPEEEVGPLIEDNRNGGTLLKRELKQRFEGKELRRLKRAIRLMYWYKRYRLIGVAGVDVNALAPKDRLKRINTDAMRSRVIEFNFRGKKYRMVVLGRKGHMLLLLDTAKGRKQKDAYAVLDTNDAVLLRKEGGKEYETSLVGNTDNVFHIPEKVNFDTAAMAA